MDLQIRRTKFNFDENEDIFFFDEQETKQIEKQLIDQKQYQQQQIKTYTQEYCQLSNLQNFQSFCKSDSEVTIELGQNFCQKDNESCYSQQQPIMQNICSLQNIPSLQYLPQISLQKTEILENYKENQSFSILQNNQQKITLEEHQNNNFINQQNKIKFQQIQNSSDLLQQQQTPFQQNFQQESQNKNQPKKQTNLQFQDKYIISNKKIVLSKKEKYIFEMIQTNIIKSAYSMIKRYIKNVINNKKTLQILEKYSVNQQMILNKFYKIPRITNRTNFKLFLYDPKKYQHGIKQFQYSQLQKENILKVIRILTLQYFQQDYVSYLFTQKHNSTSYNYSHYYLKFKDNFIMAVRGEQNCLQSLKFGKQNL